MSRLFELVRSKDISGVSGIGVVAEGVEYTDGSCAVRWKGAHPSTAVWPSLSDVLAVHGHQGDTVVRWIGEPQELTDLAGAMAKVTNLVASGMHFTGISVIDYPTERRIKVHAGGADRWLSWVGALGGRPDAAVCEDWAHPGFQSKWEWTSPEGLIRCFYLTNNPGEIELEAG